MQGNLILAKSYFSNSIEGAGGNLWGVLSEESHPLSRALGEGSASSGIQRLLKALNPYGLCRSLTKAGGGAALHLLP